jgi:hypothetical protein
MKEIKETINKIKQALLAKKMKVNLEGRIRFLVPSLAA